MTVVRVPMHLNPSKDQAGSITLFFLLLIFVIMGALSYSLYVGRSVQEKIKADTAADTAALSMANHTATGLNVISMNNLAVAGNLHVAAAIPFVGRYFAIVNALIINVEAADQYAELMASADSADKSSFGSAFDYTQEITGLLMSAAAGNTFLNRTVAKSWFYKTMPNGIQTARMNAPGALVVPTSLLGIAQADRSMTMQVQKLAQTNVEDAMCHAVTSSELGIGNDRDSFVFWLRGLLQSVKVPDILDGALSLIQTFEGAAQGVAAFLGGKVDESIKERADEVSRLTGGLKCDEVPDTWGWYVDHHGRKRKTPDREAMEGHCAKIKELGEKKAEMESFSLVPSFGSCGLAGSSGNFGSQAKAFADKFSKETDIGFIYPSITNDGDLQAFQKSINHGIVLAKPLFLKEELPKSSDGKRTQCPQEWKSTAPGGESVCDALLDGIDMGMVSTSTTTKSYQTASGGVGTAVGTSQAGDGKLRDTFSRTQWAIGEAKAQFRPGDGDPDLAATYNLNPSTHASTFHNRTRHQLFWPAWRGVNAPISGLGDVLNFLGKR